MKLPIFTEAPQGGILHARIAQQQLAPTTALSACVCVPLAWAPGAELGRSVAQTGHDASVRSSFWGGRSSGASNKTRKLNCFQPLSGHDDHHLGVPRTLSSHGSEHTLRLQMIAARSSTPVDSGSVCGCNAGPQMGGTPPVNKSLETLALG